MSFVDHGEVDRRGRSELRKGLTEVWSLETLGGYQDEECITSSDLLMSVCASSLLNCLGGDRRDSIDSMQFHAKQLILDQSHQGIDHNCSPRKAKAGKLIDQALSRTRRQKYRAVSPRENLSYRCELTLTKVILGEDGLEDVPQRLF